VARGFPCMMKTISLNAKCMHIIFWIVFPWKYPYKIPYTYSMEELEPYRVSKQRHSWGLRHWIKKLKRRGQNLMYNAYKNSQLAIYFDIYVDYILYTPTAEFGKCCKSTN
jgi:hypothetical protein